MKKKKIKKSEIEHIVKERNYTPRLEQHALIVKNLEFDNVKKVLDIGCGLGELLEVIERQTGEEKIEKFGVDIDEENVNICKENLEGDFRVLDVDKERLPYDDDSFDIVCVIGIVEHVENPSRLAREAFRVCRGKAVFMTPNLSRPRRVTCTALNMKVEQFRGHRQGWDYHLFKQYLELNGWHVDKIKPRFVDFLLYKIFPKFISRFFSYKLLLKLFPRIGSELYAFCSKEPAPPDTKGDNT